MVGLALASWVHLKKNSKLMQGKSVFGVSCCLLLLGLGSSCIEQQSEQDSSIYWQKFDLSGIQIDFFVPRGRVSYVVTLAARIDNRQDSLELPLRVRMENAYGLYLIDTVVLRLPDLRASRVRSSVAMREMNTRLDLICQLPMAGLYSCVVEPLQAPDAMGLVAVGLELTEVTHP